MINLIIFDLDGTLIDAFDPLVQSLNFALQQCGYPAQDPELIKHSVGWGERNLLAKFVREADMDRVQALYRNHHAGTLRAQVKFMPGAENVLKLLQSEGYRLAVATNRPTWSTTIILDTLKVRPLFARVVTGDMIANPKPAPDMIKRVLAELRVAPDAALFVGDMVLDVQTGNSAGVKTVGITTGTVSREELETGQAYRVVDRVAKIWDIVRNLNENGTVPHY
jgi:phosphoglycolate phosphatase